MSDEFTLTLSAKDCALVVAALVHQEHEHRNYRPEAGAEYTDVRRRIVDQINRESSNDSGAKP